MAGILLPGVAIAQSPSSTSSVAQTTSTQQTVVTQTTTTPANQPSREEQQAVKDNLKDVHFAFDSYALDDQDRESLQESANWLKANPGATISIAGNADERGDITYNLALTQKRAEAVHDTLVADGVQENRIEYVTGWGKLYPICNLSDENCWAENRRVHTTAGTTLQTETVAQRLEALPVLAWAFEDSPQGIPNAR